MWRCRGYVFMQRMAMPEGGHVAAPVGAKQEAAMGAVGALPLVVLRMV